MKNIWKFPLSILKSRTIEVPKGAEILSVQNQNNTICIWLMFDADFTVKEERTFSTVGTGQEFNAAGLVYVGTVQHGAFVWHVFEEK